MKFCLNILISIAFFTSNIAMPFYDFQNTDVVTNLYHKHLQEDPDGNLFDFITDDLLLVSNFFNDEADELPIPQHPMQHPLPLQITQLQAGFFNFSTPVTYTPQKPLLINRVYLKYAEKKHAAEFLSAVFRPPAMA